MLLMDSMELNPSVVVEWSEIVDQYHSMVHLKAMQEFTTENWEVFH